MISIGYALWATEVTGCLLLRGQFVITYSTEIAMTKAHPKLAFAAAVLGSLALAAAAEPVPSFGAPPTDEQIALQHRITVADVHRLHTEKGYSNEVLAEMGSQRVGKILWQLDHHMPDQPFAAAEYRLLQQTGGERASAAAVSEALARLATQRRDFAQLSTGTPTVVAIPPQLTLTGTPAASVAGVPVG